MNTCRGGFSWLNFQVQKLSVELGRHVFQGHFKDENPVVSLLIDPSNPPTNSDYSLIIWDPVLMTD